MAETESKSASEDKNIKFENDVIIPFHFSQIQPLEFLIKNKANNKTILVKKNLGEIVGSLRQKYTQDIEEGMVFEVKAILNDKLNKECSFNIEVNGPLTGMKIRYTITSLGNQYDPINKLVYESEILDNDSKVIFNPISIPINELAEDENLEDNMIEIVFKDLNHSDELGKYSSSISNLFENDIDFELKGNKKAKIICRKKNFHSLLDYLERDLHLNTIFAIDFSENKGTNTHHVKNDESIFEKLMENYVDVLVPYNEDPFFHIYGYGFELKVEKSGIDADMYPINNKPDSPSVEKNNIKSIYYKFLNSINFSKNISNFDLIIKKINDKIKEDVDEYDISEYNVLLLFANSDITDEKEFVNDLILSSNLPLSIIVIGLGKGPYKKIENVDKNFMNLFDNEGNKAKRKNIKFISFYKYSKNFEATVRDSLIDVPAEMIEYLSIKNIEPKN